jgi:TolB protein
VLIPAARASRVDSSDGSNQVRLTSAPQSDVPTWSADGSQLYFNSDRSGNLEVWRMESDGSNPVQLTSAPGIDFLAYWRK